MFVAGQRRPPPQPQQGHGGGPFRSGMTALDVPPEPEGRQRGRHSGLRAAVKERHMRRLAVALALTLPMMMAVSPSALAPEPTHQRLPSTSLPLGNAVVLAMSMV